MCHYYPFSIKMCALSIIILLWDHKPWIVIICHRIPYSMKSPLFELMCWIMFLLFFSSSGQQILSQLARISAGAPWMVCNVWCRVANANSGWGKNFGEHGRVSLWAFKKPTGRYVFVQWWLIPAICKQVYCDCPRKHYDGCKLLAGSTATMAPLMIPLLGLKGVPPAPI